ncbi:MAG: STAS domain-containing protein [Phycisphaerales bacterium]|nr:STAS domain-containing protein [Phycisphaerales bacterium]
MSTADELDILTERRGPALIVSLVGSASMEHCEELNERLLDACLQKPDILVIDLSRLVFMCSLGLGGLVAAYLRVQKYRGKFAIAAPDAAIKEMLELTRLHTLLPIFTSASDAVAHLNRTTE